MKVSSCKELQQISQRLLAEASKTTRTISVCCGTGCRANGALKVLNAFQEERAKRNLEVAILVKETGCHGFCEKGPLVVIYPEKIFYTSVAANDVPDILSKTIMNGEIVERLLYEDPLTQQRIVREDEVNFYNKQQRVTFGKNGLIDPTKIEDYLALGGYHALGKALDVMQPVEIIEEVKHAGLRGRGGAGFITGQKWEFCRNAKGDCKYVICNADEGDPGAFMDRSLLEGNPHSILEGMCIGAYAIGAHQGYVYVRKEYPLAVKHLKSAIEQAHEYGLLGEQILGSHFSFDIEVFQGAGAFVCGEETGLLASIEGRTGEPRFRPPFPAEKGLWDQPTNINNVKTWANVPLIINQGSQWYHAIGTDKSKGTMIFSLVGKIHNTGLIEVPMGMTLREIIFAVGGGIPNDKRFKAVQTGGPSGGCIPEALLDLPVDFDELKKAGSMMGSGGMIVMDEDTCMVDVARYFLTFLVSESCGKCTPCREGLYQQLQILERITQEKGQEGDLAALERLSETIRDASLCALGKTAPNPVLSTLRYFRDEYEQHISSQKCPAGVCKALFQYRIDADKCTGCMVCGRKCPQAAIEGEKKAVHRILQEKCTKCGICLDVCRFDAVRKV